MAYKSLAVVIILLVAFTFTNLTKANVNSSSIYLHQPAGSYGVGYKEYYLVNEKACPNAFLNEKNKDSFSVNNLSHCNEIELAVYYPSNKINSSVYHPIPSLITDVKSFSNNVSESDIEQIRGIRSHSGKNLPCVDKQFPVVFFSPGYGLPTQEYENIITELVSNGYIVIGINSQFINGEIIFNNANVSNVVEPETEEDKKNFFRNSYIDLSYVYEVLSQKQLSDSILNKISWDRVVLLGHSLGSAVVARFANQAGIHAVAALDLTIDLLEGNDCHQNLKVPFMHMFSSQLYQQNEMHEFPYLCKANESLPYKHIVIISGNNDHLYSMHMNFCDYSTLQYAPPIMSSISELKKNPDAIFLGSGNGRDITEMINHKLLAFFAKYAKN